MKMPIGGLEGSDMEDTITMDMIEYVPAPRAGGHEAPHLSLLANNEKEILVELTEGFTNREIANRLGLSVRSVGAHRERLMRKLGLRGVARLTRFAVVHGLVALDGGTESSRSIEYAPLAV
jgi:DNA-binding NarL/FixJ family response regulator